MRLPVRGTDTSTILSAVGLVGAVLMAAGSFGAGATPAAVTDETRLVEQLSQPGYAAGLAAWLTGGTLLAVAWWRLGRACSAGAVDGRRLRWTAVLWAVPFLFSAPTASRDVYAYALQGLLYAEGFDPYAVGPGALVSSPWLPAMSQFWLNSPTPYGPLAVLLSGAAAVLSGGHLVVALLWLRLSALAGVVLTAVYLPRLARSCGADPGLALWLGVASPLVSVHLLSGAHHDALTLGLLVAGLELAARRRGWQSGVALGLAAAVKATALIVLPFAVVLASAALAGTWWWRMCRGTAAVAAPAAAVFVALSVAGDLGAGWLGATPGPNAVIHWLSVPTSFGLVVGGVASLAAGSDLLGVVVPSLRIAAWYVALPIVLVVLWWRVRRSTDPRRVVTAAGYALAAAVLLSPLVYPWYYLAPIALLAAVPGRPRVRAGLAVLALFGVFITLPDGINLAHVTKWPGAVVQVVAIVVAAVWFVRRRRRPPAGRRAVGDTMTERHHHAAPS